MSIVRNCTITYNDYKNIDILVKKHIKEDASEEDLNFYNKLQILTIIFKLFWDKQPIVDHLYFLNILLHQRISEILDNESSEQCQDLVTAIGIYTVYGVNKNNIYQLSYLIQNFFLNRNITDELMLTYFVLYSILIMKYQIDNKRKIDIGVTTPSSIYFSEEDRIKIINKIKLFNLDRVVNKDTELNAIVDMTRPICRYFLSVYAKMLSIVGM